VAVEVLKRGRRTASVMASLFQQSQEVIRVLATCGNLATSSGPNLRCPTHGHGPPLLPPIKHCVRLPMGSSDPAAVQNSVRQRVILLTSTSEAAMFSHVNNRQLTAGKPTHNEESLRPNAKADYGAWISLVDGEAFTLAAAPVLLDAGLPPVLAVLNTGWVPTIEWSVQIKQHPSPGPLRCRFKTTTIAGGLLEEEGELWDTAGNRVAVSRQLAMVGARQKRGGRATL